MKRFFKRLARLDTGRITVTPVIFHYVVMSRVKTIILAALVLSSLQFLSLSVFIKEEKILETVNAENIDLVVLAVRKKSFLPQRDGAREANEIDRKFTLSRAP
jgi:hypothetical protein